MAAIALLDRPESGGLLTVVESGLNERSSNDNRGSIMAIYTTVSLGVIASGMLMSNALGSVIGLLIYSGLAALGWRQAFISVIACAFATCVVISLVRIKTHEVSREHYEPFQPLSKTTVEAVGLEPRLPE